MAYFLDVCSNRCVVLLGEWREYLKMKLIVAGSRDFTDYQFAKQYLDAIHAKYGINSVLCGMARGADMIGYKWAKENHIEIKEFPADWDRIGKRAGYIRNEQMAEVGTHLLALHMNNSKGTQHMINIAKERCLKVMVVNV